MRVPSAIVALPLIVVAMTAGLAGQSPTPPRPAPSVVIVPAHDVGSLEGAALYEAYCAACHGRDGKGDGPAARSMPTPVPDLTRIAATHDGRDCARHLIAELQDGHRRPHEPRMSEQDLDMPNWWPIFRSIQSDEAVAYYRLRNVALHVASLQAK